MKVRKSKREKEGAGRTVGTDVPSQLHVSTCPVSSFWNALPHSEWWPSPSLLHQSKAHLVHTAFPIKWINVCPFSDSLYQTVSVPCLFAVDYIRTFLLLFLGLSHVSHMYFVFCSRVSGQQVEWGLKSSPTSFLHANSTSRGRSECLFRFSWTSGGSDCPLTVRLVFTISLQRVCVLLEAQGSVRSVWVVPIAPGCR